MLLTRKPSRLLASIALLPITLAKPLPQTTNHELVCLASNIYHEARGESLRGQRLVALVTLNRAKTLGTICRAVFEPNQFSWTLNQLPKYDHETWRVAWVAYHNYKPNQLYYYHNHQVKPNWRNLVRLGPRVGNHQFYYKP